MCVSFAHACGSDGFPLFFWLKDAICSAMDATVLCGDQVTMLHIYLKNNLKSQYKPMMDPKPQSSSKG